MGGWYLLVYNYSFNQLEIKILLTNTIAKTEKRDLGFRGSR